MFHQETMAVGKKHFTPDLNEKQVIELLENATPGRGSKKKATKIFHGKSLKTLF